MSEEQPRTPNTDIVIIAAVWSALGLLLATLPLRNWDYWFALTVGRLLDVHHAIVNTNIFGFSAPPDTPVFLQPWIGDFWLFRLHEFGGLVATIATRNVCALVALAALSWCAYQLSQRHAVATSVVMLPAGLTFLAIAGFTGPQMFVWPVFAILAMVFVASRSWERMWPVPMLTALGTAFWTNAAPNFWAPVALALVFAAVGQFSGDSRRRNWYLASAAAAVCAMFTTPLGTSVFLALLNGTGSETWLVLGATLAFAPMVTSAPRFRRPMGRRLQVATVSLMVLVVTAAQPWTDAHRAIPAAVFGSAVRQTDPLRGLGPSNTPVEAVEILRSWGSQPRVYAAPHLSGYLLYELQNPNSPERIVWPLPDWQPTAELSATEAAMKTDPEVLRGVFHQMNVQAVLVTPEIGAVGGFIAKAPDWVLLGEWPSGALYIRER